MILTSEAIKTKGIRTGESTLVLVSTTRVACKWWGRGVGPEGGGGGGDALPCVPPSMRRLEVRLRAGNQIQALVVAACATAY